MKQSVYEYDFRKDREHRRKIVVVTLTVVFVVLFISLFLRLILFPVLVRSDTMSPSVERNSVVFVAPLSRSPGRGDVVYVARLDGKTLPWWQSALDDLVAFVTAQQFRPFSSSRQMTGKETLRRVIALPGDTIYMKDYTLYVRAKGEAHFLTEFEIAKKPYNPRFYSPPSGWTSLGLSGDFGEIVLGEGEYFLLADNRLAGSDSRLWGAVDASSIRGRAVVSVLPFKKLSRL